MISEDVAVASVTATSDVSKEKSEAKEFAERTGVAALAVAVGTAHGRYKQAPKLAIDRIRFTRYPRVAELEAEARIVYPVVMAGNKDEDAVKRANEIAAELAPTMDLYALGIIEYPFLTSPEDVEELMDSLSDEEQEAIRQMLGVLTAWGRPVDFSQLEIAERFHLQIIPIEAVEDPTYQQYRALYSVVEQEHEATRDMYSKLGVKM